MNNVTPLALCAALALNAAPVAAKPHLRDVAQIDDGLMYLGIADDLRKKCKDIDARMFRALGYVNRLKSQAQSLGYSDDELDDYRKSKAEKRRIRAKAEAWLAAQGVTPGDKATYCAFGRREISRGSTIGSLLKAK